MTTINISIPQVFIYTLIFVILYNIAYWYITLGESFREIIAYKFANRIVSILSSIFIILLFKAAYCVFSNIHLKFTL